MPPRLDFCSTPLGMVCENAGQVSVNTAKNKNSFMRIRGPPVESEYSAFARLPNQRAVSELNRHGIKGGSTSPIDMTIWQITKCTYKLRLRRIDHITV